MHVTILVGFPSLGVDRLAGTSTLLWTLSLNPLLFLALESQWREFKEQMLIYYLLLVLESQWREFKEPILIDCFVLLSEQYTFAWMKARRPRRP